MQTIRLPGVKGHLDHMGVDLETKHLFVAAVANNSLEVVDLTAGESSDAISDSAHLFASVKALALLHSIPALRNSIFARVPIPPLARRRTGWFHKKCPCARQLPRGYLRTAYSGPGHSVGPR
jgi:hypothetical protein